jgi:hypothetical protein
MTCAFTLLAFVAVAILAAYAKDAGPAGTSNEPNPLNPSEGAWGMTELRYIADPNGKREEHELFADIANLRQQVQELKDNAQRHNVFVDIINSDVKNLRHFFGTLAEEVRAGPKPQQQQPLGNWTLACIESCMQMIARMPIPPPCSRGCLCEDDMKARIELAKMRWANQVECMDKCSKGPTV